MQSSHTGVLIIGAGPTGLTLRAELARRGIEASLVDRLAEGQNTSRAAVVHAHTLEVLEALGVTPELIANGLTVATMRIRETGKVLMSIAFQELKTKYPFALLCPQDRTESILLRRLELLGGTVERPWELVRMRPVMDEVEAELTNGSTMRAVRAKWIVGCDGMHSAVRELSSIPFEGSAYEESFVLADIEMESWPLGREEVSLFLSPAGMMVMAPLPDNHFRMVATLPDAPEHPNAADVLKLLQERGPGGDVSVRQVFWSSRFHIQHRVAKVFRQGKILLAGDAAHVHSPAGGQGMNTGIQDAVALAYALQRTLVDRDADALAAWEKQRLDIAHSVVNMTDTMTKIGATSSPGLQALRNAGLSLMSHIPFARQAIARKAAELDRQDAVP